MSDPPVTSWANVRRRRGLTRKPSQREGFVGDSYLTYLENHTSSSSTSNKLLEVPPPINEPTLIEEVSAKPLIVSTDVGGLVTSVSREPEGGESVTPIIVKSSSAIKIQQEQIRVPKVGGDPLRKKPSMPDSSGTPFEYSIVPPVVALIPDEPLTSVHGSSVSGSNTRHPVVGMEEILASSEYESSSAYSGLLSDERYNNSTTRKVLVERGTNPMDVALSTKNNIRIIAAPEDQHASDSEQSHDSTTSSSGMAPPLSPPRSTPAAASDMGTSGKSVTILTVPESHYFYHQRSMSSGSSPLESSRGGAHQHSSKNQIYYLDRKSDVRKCRCGVVPGTSSLFCYPSTRRHTSSACAEDCCCELNNETVSLNGGGLVSPRRKVGFPLAPLGSSTPPGALQEEVEAARKLFGIQLPSPGGVLRSGGYVSSPHSSRNRARV